MSVYDDESHNPPVTIALDPFHGDFSACNKGGQMLSRGCEGEPRCNVSAKRCILIGHRAAEIYKIYRCGFVDIFEPKLLKNKLASGMPREVG